MLNALPQQVNRICADSVLGRVDTYLSRGCARQDPHPAASRPGPGALGHHGGLSYGSTCAILMATTTTPACTRRPNLTTREHHTGVGPG